MKLRSAAELEHTMADDETTRDTLFRWQLRLWEDREEFNFAEYTKRDKKEEAGAWEDGKPEQFLDSELEEYS